MNSINFPSDNKKREAEEEIFLLTYLTFIPLTGVITRSNIQKLAAFSWFFDGRRR